MNFLKHLKIGQRLGLAFGVMLAITLALGAYAAVQLGRVNQTSTDMDENWMPSVATTGALNTAIGDFRAAELQHVLSTDAAQSQMLEKTMSRVSELIAKKSQAFESLISDPDKQEIWDRFKQRWAGYLELHKQVLQLSSGSDGEQAQILALGQSEMRFAVASDILDHLVALNIQGGKDASHQADLLYSTALKWLMAAIAMALTGGLLAAVSITRSITRPIVRAVEVAETVANGDLTSVIDDAGHDEVAQLLKALKAMNESLARTVGQVRAGADSIATGSNQIAIGNNDLSQRTEEQASNLEQTAASMEELTSTVRQNADTARQASQLAQSASEAAASGGQVVARVVTTIQDIADSSRKISDIIGVIDGIAFQTNILARNAAVEAARAGEQGRGFAVVAGEVRSLAQRSAEAAKQIKGLIGASVEKVEAGTHLADSAGQGMGDIVAQVKRVNDLIAEISAASAEQTQGISQVGDALGLLDQVTQQNAALVEESAAAADSLKEQAARLAQVVQAFRIDASSERTSGVVSSPAPGHKRAAMPTVPAARARQLPLVVNTAVVRSAPRSDAVSVAAPQRISAASPASKSAATPAGKPASQKVAAHDDGDWESF